MKATATETVTNEINDTLGYLIDKFNLTLEISSTQIKEFSEQFARKIITWEIAESILTILLMILLIVITLKLAKILKLDSFKAIKKVIESNEPGRDTDKAVGALIIKIGIGVLIFTFGIIAIQELIDIVMCMTFPEKIVLEFISKYI